MERSRWAGSNIFTGGKTWDQRSFSARSIPDIFDPSAYCGGPMKNDWNWEWEIPRPVRELSKWNAKDAPFWRIRVSITDCHGTNPKPSIRLTRGPTFSYEGRAQSRHLPLRWRFPPKGVISSGFDIRLHILWTTLTWSRSSDGQFRAPRLQKSLPVFESNPEI